jgi:ribulose-bisphosphate carboxylase small chain
MTLRLETFSFLPPLSADDIRRQIEHILNQGWLPIVEYSTEPSEFLWSWWKLPMLEATTNDVIAELDDCASAHPHAYVRLVGWDSAGGQRPRVAFVTHRPE